MADQILNSIESALAHQERQIQDLNDVVLQQAKDIEFLKKQISRLHGKIGVLENTPDEKLSTLEQAVRDKPPHY